MNATLDFVLEEIIDEAMAFDAGFSGKGTGDDEDAKMTFPRAWRASMPCVKFRLVDDVEPCRAKLDHQLFAKAFGNGHSVLLSLTVNTI